MISTGRISLWVFALTMISVGLRNFETGMSIDGHLYATIARNMARTGEFFFMDSWIPDFSDGFAEHPHLGFWIHALFLKIFPAQDWAIRIPSHLFYFFFLLSFFDFIKRVGNERMAVIALTLLILFPRFPNFFSGTYLDGPCLFFGFLSYLMLYRVKDADSALATWGFSALSGLFLALATLQKGLTALGFLLPLAYAGFLVLKNKKYRLSLLSTLSLVLTCVLVLGFYLDLLSQSQDPEFLSRYWQRQFSNRFSHITSITGLVSAQFWHQLFLDTHYLLPMGIIYLVYYFKRTGVAEFKHSNLMIPVIWMLSFVALYAPAGRMGAQYWIMILPWAAWICAYALDTFFKFSHAKFVSFSTTLVLILIAIVQYLPTRVHAGFENPSSAVLNELQKKIPLIAQVIDDHKESLNFVTTSKYAWYGNMPVEHSYRNEPLNALSLKNKALIIRNPTEERIHEARTQGWCPLRVPTSEKVFIECELGQE